MRQGEGNLHGKLWLSTPTGGFGGWLALILLLAGSGPALAQEALVLSGGGSRGIAHAGVVLGLERLGHQPRLVVGTSAGAIVGGLYAAGYAPAAIWRILQQTDWAEVFAPPPVLEGPDRAVRYPVVRVAIGAERVRLFGGFVPELRINRMLVRLLFDAGVRAGGDFDRLPRRFRAVAADLEMGEEVVLARGDLARAVRASMAVPGVFSPVEWEGRVLVDGGIADNMPISVARELGSSVVIASDVLRPLPRIEERDPLSVGLRALRLLLRNAQPRAVPPDILILPRLGPGLAEATFPADPGPLLEAGLEAALSTAPRADPPAPRPPPPDPPPARLAGVQVQAKEAGAAVLLEHAFRPAAAGAYDPARILEAVDRVYATGLFHGVWPTAVPPVPPAAQGSEPATDTMPRPDPVLLVRTEPTPRVLAEGGAGYDNDRGVRVWAGLRSRTAGVARLPAELDVAGAAGGLERWAAASLRLYSLRLLPLVWSAGGYYQEADVRRFIGERPAVEREVRRAGGWLTAELRRLEPGRVLVAGIRAERVEEESGRDGFSLGPLVRMGEIEPLTPVAGAPTLLEAEWRLGEVGYLRARARGSVHGWAGRWRGAAVGDLTLVGGEPPADVRPALGDEHLMPGMRWGEERGQIRAVAGADVVRNTAFDVLARLRLRLGAAAAVGDELGRSATWVAGAELGLVRATPLGPIELAVGANGRGEWRLDVVVGAK